MTRREDIALALREPPDADAARAAGSRKPSIRLRKLRPATRVVGRDQELQRMRAAHDDVSAAIVLGIPGAGKSALALAYASSWDGPVVYVKLDGGSTLATLIAAADSLLSATPRGDPGTAQEQLMALWETVDRARCLMIVDDLHALEAPAQRLVVDSAAVALGDARLLAISRELVPRSSSSPDRMEMRLAPLDLPSARELWERLDALYGPGGEFASAWQRSRGNPLLLRRAHVQASAAAERDPLELAVHALTPPERRLANIFAVARRSLPLDLVTGLPDAERAPLQALVTRLIVDRQPDGAYQMHELWREVIARELDDEGRRLADEELVAALAGSTLDPPAKEPSCQRGSLGHHVECRALLAGEGGAVIDGLRHEIRIGARRIPLRARPVSRQLLYAFAAAPSQYLARNTIARVLWGSDYDPLRHESTLKSNIRRLRMLLAGFAELGAEAGGYRIMLPDGVELIPPVVPPVVSDAASDVAPEAVPDQPPGS